MKILFAVDSFFQLIQATNLRLTVFKEYDVDIAVYASTPNAKEICENLSECELFDVCYFLDTPLVRCGAKYTFAEKLPKYFIYLFTLITPCVYTKNKLGIKDLGYDYFLFSGNGALPECIFNSIRKKNKNIRCMRFEDSYVSYTKEYGKKKGKPRRIFEKVMHFVFNNANIDDFIEGYYFSEPELVQVKFDYPILKAPKISRNNINLIKTLNKIFSYNDATDSYTEKYIFFESGDSYFEKNDEDVFFIRELVKLVGANQILIKRHPRCIENRFDKLGVHVATSSSIPWELVQLNVNMDGKVFITTTSAAALSSAVYFGDDSKSVLLFEAMKQKPLSVTDSMRRYMCAFQNKYGDKVLFMPNGLEDFKHIIEEES